MSTNALRATASSLYEPSARIVLFDLDITLIGGPLVHFTEHVKPDQSSIFFGGIEYVPVPISAEGFEVSAQGSLPSPRLRISNVLGVAASLLQNNENLLGAQVTRIVTYEKFLDGGSEADPNAHFLKDIFIIDRKSEHNNVQIEFELRSLLDQQGSFIPKRQILRDTCTHRYRVHDPNSPDQSFPPMQPDRAIAGERTGGPYDYTKTTCPYVGPDLFSFTGVATSEFSNDVCGKKVSDCKLRFEPNPLPFLGFPGVGRTRAG